MPPQPQQPSPPPVAATIHIYRGLMDRATTWRLRIDTSTNWAIITSGTAVSFALSDPSHSHAVLLIVMLLTIAFVSIEARRTRYYDLWSAWVRLLETDYFVPILRDNQVSIDDLWERLLVRDLDFPHFKTTFWQTLGRRLRDNYLAIELFLILVWLLKLLLHPLADQGLPTYERLIRHAAIGPVPGLVVFSAVFGCYAVLLLLVLATYYTRAPSIEVLMRERTMRYLTSPSQQPISGRRWMPDLLPHSSDDLSEQADLED